MQVQSQSSRYSYLHHLFTNIGKMHYLKGMIKEDQSHYFHPE